MSIENLNKKAKENLEVAEWAEKKKYYDVAISRHYYCEYQKIIYISKKLGFYVESQNGEDSHIKTINNFISSPRNKLSDEDKIEISKMQRLRRYRNDADYGEKKMEGNDYNLAFKFCLQSIQDITNKILEGK